MAKRKITPQERKRRELAARKRKAAQGTEMPERNKNSFLSTQMHIQPHRSAEVGEIETKQEEIQEDIRFSIVIPCYSEPFETLINIASSINNQIGVDFSAVEVVFVYDGDYSELMEKDFIFQNIRKACPNIQPNMTVIDNGGNSGPGMARQMGINAASGEYILFCDADDILYSVDVLKKIDHILTENPQITFLRTKFYEELKTVDQSGNEQLVYIEHGMDNTWMHGKVFKREFLLDYDINFHPELRVHEDSYFLSLASSFCKEDHVAYAAIDTYVWQYNEESITRRNDAAYTFESFTKFIDAIVLSWREIISVEKDHPHMPIRMIQLVLYIYFTLYSKPFQDAPKKYIREIEQHTGKRLSHWFKRYMDDVSEEIFSATYHEEMKKNWKNGEYVKEPIFDWFQRMFLTKQGS